MFTGWNKEVYAQCGQFKNTGLALTEYKKFKQNDYFPTCTSTVLKNSLYPQ